MFFSFTFKPAEQKKEAPVLIFAPFPSLSTASKAKLVDAKALNSRRGKWDLMLIGKQFSFKQEGQLVPRIANPKRKQEVEPEWHVFTDGSKQSSDGEMSQWAYVIKRGE